MAFLLEVDFRDVNGEVSSTSVYVATRADGLAVIQQLDVRTNALITGARLVTPIPLQTIINNDAVAANVETARTKAKIRLRGFDTGSLANPLAHATIGVPAPIGTLINGLSGDNTNADAVGLASHVLSASGVQMTAVEKIYYSRGR